MCFTADAIESCQKLGVTRSLLSLSNLDRMTKTVSANDHFTAISVIDGDQILWVFVNIYAMRKTFFDKS